MISFPISNIWYCFLDFGYLNTEESEELMVSSFQAFSIILTGHFIDCEIDYYFITDHRLWTMTASHSLWHRVLCEILFVEYEFFNNLESLKPLNFEILTQDFCCRAQTNGLSQTHCSLWPTVWYCTFQWRRSVYVTITNKWPTNFNWYFIVLNDSGKVWQIWKFIKISFTNLS